MELNMIKNVERTLASAARSVGGVAGLDLAVNKKVPPNLSGGKIAVPRMLCRFPYSPRLPRTEYRGCLLIFLFGNSFLATRPPPRRAGHVYAVHSSTSDSLMPSSPL